MEFGVAWRDVRDRGTSHPVQPDQARGRGRRGSYAAGRTATPDRSLAAGPRAGLRSPVAAEAATPARGLAFDNRDRMPLFTSFGERLDEQSRKVLPKCP